MRTLAIIKNFLIYNDENHLDYQGLSRLLTTLLLMEELYQLPTTIQITTALE